MSLKCVVNLMSALTHLPYHLCSNVPDFEGKWKMGDIFLIYNLALLIEERWGALFLSFWLFALLAHPYTWQDGSFGPTKLHPLCTLYLLLLTLPFLVSCSELCKYTMNSMQLHLIRDPPTPSTGDVILRGYHQGISHKHRYNFKKDWKVR